MGYPLFSSKSGKARTIQIPPLRVSKEEKQLIERKAEELGESETQIIRLALRQFLVPQTDG